MSDELAHPTASTAPGSARCPGPSTSELIAADGDAAPRPLVEHSYHFIGDRDLEFSRYTDPDFHAAELRTVWSRTWQWACREEHVPAPGDFHVYDVGDRSALIVRGTDGQLRAFVNSCPHRGMQFSPAGTHGHGKQFLRCPFHGMSWHLDGSLRDIPCRWDFPHVEDETFRLTELPLDTWGGFIFINFDRDARPLAEFLGVLPEHFRAFAYPLEQRYVALHMHKTLPGNWKMCLEGFLEAYHVLATHPEGLRTAGDANAQYDFWGPHVSRFVHTVGYQSPHLANRPSEQELFRNLGHGDAPLPPGVGARQQHAVIMRERLGALLGVDLSHVSTSQMLDSIQYFLFPNAFFFPGIGIPLIYRFRPIDVDHCIHEIIMLQPVPTNAPRPPPAEVVHLGINDSYKSVPAFVATGLAHVLDQDTENFFQQRAGIKAASKQGQTLGNYQEARIRHLHQTLDTYLAG